MWRPWWNWCGNALIRRCNPSQQEDAHLVLGNTPTSYCWYSTLLVPLAPIYTPPPYTVQEMGMRRHYIVLSTKVKNDPSNICIIPAKGILRNWILPKIHPKTTYRVVGATVCYITLSTKIKSDPGDIYIIPDRGIRIFLLGSLGSLPKMKWSKFFSTFSRYYYLSGSLGSLLRSKDSRARPLYFFFLYI